MCMGFLQKELRELADGFDRMERMGAERDVPEGACYVKLSDTLAQQIALTLRRAADRLPTTDH